MGSGAQEETTEQQENFGHNANLEIPEMDNLQKLKFERIGLVFLSGHRVDTLMGLGGLVDTLSGGEQYANLTEKISFRLCGVVSEVEGDTPKRFSPGHDLIY